MATETPAPTAALGSILTGILMGDDIQPGDQPGYELCKQIYLYHPLGPSMAETPISIAQSQARKLSVPKGPELRLVEAFERKWKELGCDRHIFNAARLARIYGVSTVALMVEGTGTAGPVDYESLWEKKVTFNVLDPLNTAGSLVLSQDPNSFDFLKPANVTVAGQPYHRSRIVTVLNEEPIYIAYTSSGFGFVGRSVYQRALYPLKSFIQTMITDNMVSLKAGVIVAKMASPSSAIDGVMDALFGQKREIVKEAIVGNVISVGTDEDIESLNLTNIDASSRQARVNILDNIATAGDMPAVLLNQETFAEGFGEGTEDAKRVAQFIGRVRIWLQPLYSFFDDIVMKMAWTPEFYKNIQLDFPEVYKDVEFPVAFYVWKNSFEAEWPNLLQEPDSELVKVDDVRLKALIALIQVISPELDPENKAKLIETALTNVNSMKMLFPEPFSIDIDLLLDYAEEQAKLQREAMEAGAEPQGQPGQTGAGRVKKPMPRRPTASMSDSLAALDEAVARLPDLRAQREARRLARR